MNICTYLQNKAKLVEYLESMKMTKTQLKNIVKECILELAKEGQLNEIASKSDQQFRSGNYSQKTNLQEQSYGDLAEREKLRSTIRQSFVEEDSFMQHISSDQSFTSGLQRPARFGPAPDKMLIENLAMNMAKGDASHAAKYAAIFADTAINTVPQQAAAGDTQGAAPYMTNGNMTEVRSHEGLQKLSGGDVGRWATVAFGGKKAK